MMRAGQTQLSFDWEEIERVRQNPRTLFEDPRADILSKIPEGQTFERKRAKIDARELAATISAMSNSDASGGLIAVGITDRGEIEGFESVGEGKLNELLNAPLNFCPAARVQTKIAPLVGKSVLLMLVEHSAYRVVERSDGAVFLRAGDQNRSLSPDEIVRLKNEKGEIPFELELVQDASMEELDAALVQEFADAVRERDDLQYAGDNEGLLRSKRLGELRAGRYVPNNAAILLFGKDPIRRFPGCKVRFIRYEGTEERMGQELNVIKDAVIEGPVPLHIRRAVDVLSSQLREFRSLSSDGRFRVVPEYPPDCVTEAIVNACVHRSFVARNQNVFIRMFDDRLEVESPGGFMPPVTPQNIYEHHVPRNPLLMDALRYLRYVRCANEGTRRMRDLMQRNNLPEPTFQQTSDRLSQVVVTLRNRIEQRRTWIDRDIAKLVGVATAETLTPDEKRVLNHLAEFKKITVSEVTRITKVKSWETAKKMLLRLQERGLLVRVAEGARDPKAHFVLSEKGRANGGNGH